MGWLAERRERNRLNRERIAALNREYKNVFMLNKGPFYRSDSQVASPQRIYTFCEGAPDGDSSFQRIALEAMEKILRPYQVLTHVYTYVHEEDGIFHSKEGMCRYKRKKPCPNYVPYWRRYYQFLQHHGLAENAYLSDKGYDIIRVSQGLDMGLMRADVAERVEFNPNTSYGYLKMPFEATTFDEALQKAESSPYDICMSLCEWHDFLEICINPETVDIATMAGILREVCEKHGKKLEDNSRQV